MQPNWGLYAVLGVFAATFAAGAAFLVGQRLTEPAPEPAAEIRPAAEAPPAPPENEKPKPPPPPPAPKDPAPKPVHPLSLPVILRTWEVTAPPKPSGKEEPNYEDYFVRELCFTPSGTRVVTRTNFEAACWDAATGQRLHTFKAATRVTPRKPPEKPEVSIDQVICLSPDGRFVALVNKNGKEATLYRTENGSLVGTYRTPRDRGNWIDHHPPTFTPEGEYLLMSVQENDRRAICAISTRTATSRIVDLARDWGKQTSDRWRVLAPIPREKVFIRHLNTYSHQPGDVSGVYVFDQRTGKDRALKSIPFRPFSLFENRGIKVAPGGQYLTARAEELILVDWKNDRKVRNLGKGPFLNEWFTPDGRRLAAHHTPDRIYYEMPSMRRVTPVGGWLELYDIFTGNQVGEFVMEHHDLYGLSTVGFRHDGKIMALADRRTRVAVVDFERGFGVAPLPPLPAPAGAETLPVR